METISRENGILAWHFADGMKLRDGTPLEVGRVYHVDPPIFMCARGLHASVRAIDALHYAPGETVSRVRMFGDVEIGSDKLVATDREVIACADATETLRAFARWCALSVAHLWNMPPVVREYLETGDESKRDAAWAAARDAAWEAAWAAARDAARDAAWEAAWAAARAAARDAAHVAARAAAQDAARAAAQNAAWYAAWYAGRDAARDAAWVAAWGTAWDAARDAAWDAQNIELESRLSALLEQDKGE